MKNIKTVTVRLTDLADRLGFEVTDTLWPFIAAKIASGEVRHDAERGTLTYPEFIPVDQMVADVLEAMADGRIEIRTCVACRQVLDANDDDGIFGDLENLDRYVCSECADTIPARRFYEDFLKH